MFAQKRRKKKKRGKGGRPLGEKAAFGLLPKRPPFPKRVKEAITPRVSLLLRKGDVRPKEKDGGVTHYFCSRGGKNHFPTSSEAQVDFHINLEKAKKGEPGRRGKKKGEIFRNILAQKKGRISIEVQKGASNLRGGARTWKKKRVIFSRSWGERVGPYSIEKTRP